MIFSNKNIFIILTAALVLIIAYFTIFGNFIPNRHEKLGHDYTFYIPALLDGYFWHQINGPWNIPWFTPSFCGGSLNAININNGYYTVPQFFTFLTDPLSAVRLTLVVFAGLGFCGFYLLLRNAFLTSPATALFGAGLFLFNGFYAHRMLIGHIFIHSFMLLPFIIFLLLRPLPERPHTRRMRIRFDIIMGGFLFAYMVTSGLSSFMLPCIISIVIIGLIHGLFFGNHMHFWFRWIGSGIAGFFLCLSKLTAIYYLMSNFPRDTYKLPGAQSFLSAAWLMLKSLFISPAFDSYRIEMLTNVQWSLLRHEWEYSVTIVPLVIILFGLWCIFRQMLAKDLVWELSWKQWLQAGAMATLLLLPILVNTYSPDWNAFLKKLPLVKNASNLIRWFVIYIPIAILAAALMLEKIIVSSKYRTGIVVISMAAVVSLNAFVERDFYKRQDYDPVEIVKSYYKVKTGLWKPVIKQIAVYVNTEGKIITGMSANDMLVHGASQLFCYEPMFGYRQEGFPIKSLHPGPVFEEKEGLLNIKNPACYVWPQANNCEPGDHFTAEQKDAAEAFVNYRPYTFKVPAVQKAANWVNAMVLSFAFLFLFFYNARVIYHYFKKENGTP